MKFGSRFKKKEKTIILPKIFSKFLNIRAGMSTRIGNEYKSEFGMNLSYTVGDDPACVERNRKIFFSHIGISEHDLAIPHQCHSNNVLRVDAPGEYKESDAIITNAIRVAAVVTVADCVPILLFDPINRAIGAVHAGWKGTVGLIVKRTVEKMKTEFKTDPALLVAYIGPSAGVCCYEVGEEVAVMFRNKIVHSHKKVFIDLKKENMLQLMQLGVSANNIEISSSCTICEKKLFHSFRRDSLKAGRMMAVICMT